MEDYVAKDLRQCLDLLSFLKKKHIRNFEQDAIEELSLIIEKITVYPGGKLAAEFISGEEQRISINKRITVTYCSPTELEADAEELPCEQCGVLVKQHPKRKRKRFCSDACRMRWWNDHRYLREPNTVEINCRNCGKVVKAIKGNRRKYCCHECYIKDRLGKRLPIRSNGRSSNFCVRQSDVRTRIKPPC